VKLGDLNALLIRDRDAPRCAHVDAMQCGVTVARHIGSAIEQAVGHASP
jgi:hypothetical protein